MKKFVLVLMMTLLASCLLIGCGKESNYGTPLPMQELKWGMRASEVRTALHLADAVVPDSTGAMTVQDAVVYGQTTDLKLRFDETYGALIEVAALIPQGAVEEVEKRIQHDRGEGKPAYNDKMELQSVSWEDEALEEHPAWLSRVIAFYDRNGIATSEDPMEDGAYLNGSPLTRWTLIVDKNDPSCGLISFTGQIAAILAFPVNDEAR
ncbi:hypothetical protein [Paenibacillus sacheonensis]|uniref:Lipoprotein n=1 Tax=Paenibacillus sacheonensis TaxID=742054 RepID=A0A7X5BZV4_9BACL|nr:hypothetical protein [Paenibacillus sacheonensis]MBM7563878.1 hypothetical protein [Paenibacillus sacheonensis]NBC67774.1 hypothetical protein [Paenibacillus sacheonensis]